MNPSHATRFRKGRSGNPSGRPRKPTPPAASAFDILFDRTLTVTQSGATRTLTVEEALQFRLYEQAIAGRRMAIRAVLRMIAIREKALAAKPPPAIPVRIVDRMHDPDNAYDALLILGIALPDPDWCEQMRERQLLLKPWAVQLALHRNGRALWSEKDTTTVQHLTHRPETLRWPRRVAR